MARPRNTARYDASADVIKQYFEDSWQAREEQKAASVLITDVNSRMEAAGVHPGVLSVMRRIKSMPAGKRGFSCSSRSATSRCSSANCATQHSSSGARWPGRTCALSGKPRRPEAVRLVRHAAEERLGVGSEACKVTYVTKLMPRPEDRARDRGAEEYLGRIRRRQRDLAKALPVA